MECKVWSVKCEVWSVECRGWSVECRARTATRAAPATKNATDLLKTLQKQCACRTNDFRHVCRHVRMSGSATPATQNDITTCLETFEKERSEHNLNSQTPRVKQEPLLRIREKITGVTLFVSCRGFQC